MSHQDTVIDPQVDMDKLKRFCRQKGMSERCSRCQSDQWLFNLSEPLGYLPVGGDPDGTHQEAIRAIPLIWLVCANCGNAEFIVQQVWLNWLMEESQRNVAT